MGPLDQEFDDAALIRAARKRIMRELEAQQAGGGSPITNNVFSGGGGGIAPGLMERMNGAEAEDPSLRDYLVDITREDLPDINPATGKPVGWKKSVHRYVREKKK